MSMVAMTLLLGLGLWNSWNSTSLDPSLRHGGAKEVDEDVVEHMSEEAIHGRGSHGSTMMERPAREVDDEDEDDDGDGDGDGGDDGKGDIDGDQTEGVIDDEDHEEDNDDEDVVDSEAESRPWNGTDVRKKLEGDAEKESSDGDGDDDGEEEVNDEGEKDQEDEEVVDDEREIQEDKKESEKLIPAATTLDKKNIDDIIIQSTKDALVMFYNPSCGYCRLMAPFYNEAAQNLTKRFPDMVVGAYPLSMNDNITKRISIEAVPDIRYFPSGPKNLSLLPRYEGERNVGQLVKFAVKGRAGQL